MDVSGDTLGPRKGTRQLSGEGMACIVFGDWPSLGPFPVPGEPRNGQGPDDLDLKICPCPGEAGGFGSPSVWDPAETLESSFCSSSRSCWSGTVWKWIFVATSASCLMLFPVFQPPSQRPLLHTSCLLWPFRLPALKLALGEIFLILIVEQILFNLTMVYSLVLLAPLPSFLHPTLHCDRLSLSACTVTAAIFPGARRSTVEMNATWPYHEVDFRAPKGRNIQGPTSNVFGWSVTWSLLLCFPWDSVSLGPWIQPQHWLSNPIFRTSAPPFSLVLYAKPILGPFKCQMAVCADQSLLLASCTLETIL